MRKKFLVVLLMLGLLAASAPAIAEVETLEVAGQEMAKAVRENPVDVGEYVSTQIEYWADILARLLKTGKPALIFSEGVPTGALSATAIENIFTDKADLVIGWTLLNDEPAQFFWGIQFEVELSGTLGEIFARLKPAVYVVDGKFLWGFGFELRSE